MRPTRAVLAVINAFAFETFARGQEFQALYPPIGEVSTGSPARIDGVKTWLRVAAGSLLPRAGPSPARAPAMPTTAAHQRRMATAKDSVARVEGTETRVEETETRGEVREQRLPRVSLRSTPGDARRRGARVDVDRALDRHRLIACEELFRGTLAQTSVYPREVVKAALRHNAGAVVFAHNHPSGVAEPSRADEMLTSALKQALALIDVRTIDHFVVAGTVAVSFAERGLL